VTWPYDATLGLPDVLRACTCVPGVVDAAAAVCARMHVHVVVKDHEQPDRDWGEGIFFFSRHTGVM
jgi:hypothetical protein